MIECIQINDENYVNHLGVSVDGKPVGYGLIPRNYSLNPVGYAEGSKTFDAVEDMPLIPWEEIPERIAEKDAEESWLDDMRMRGQDGGPIPSLDQNGFPYCWSFSVTSAAMLLRMSAGLPPVRLCGTANAAMIKNFVQEGGWGALALERGMSIGIPSVEFWKEKSMSRSNDNPATWINAGLHKIGEGWIDLHAAVYDRQLSAQQSATCLLQNVPGIFDYPWWSHSVCGVRLLDVHKDRSARDISRYGIRIWNSWSDNWGTKGMGDLVDGRAWPGGGVAPRTITISMQ